MDALHLDDHHPKTSSRVGIVDFGRVFTEPRARSLNGSDFPPEIFCTDHAHTPGNDL